MYKQLSFLMALCLYLSYLGSAQTELSALALSSFGKEHPANDSSGYVSYPIRLSVQTGLALLHFEEHSESRYSVFVLGLGLVTDTWWTPAPHLYLNIARQRYKRFSISANEWRDKRFVSIYPSIKLAHALLFGFGYSTGEEELTLDYRNGRGPFTRTFTISMWNPFVALDFDFKVYQSWYIASGIHLQGGVFFLALGISAHL